MAELNQSRLEYIEKAFGKSGVLLADEDRVLVGEGVLKKLCTSSLKKRHFFLFTDVLIYATIVVPKKKFKNQHVLALDEVRIENVQDYKSYKYGWAIKAREKSFLVYATSLAEKKDWMSHISLCIEDFLRKTGRRGFDDFAPIWVPNHVVSCCMVCQIVTFNFFKRRHHCRKCGLVVCRSCSRNRIKLPNQRTLSVRVCLPCYAIVINRRSVESSDESVTNSSDGDTSLDVYCTSDEASEPSHKKINEDECDPWKKPDKITPKEIDAWEASIIEKAMSDGVELPPEMVPPKKDLEIEGLDSYEFLAYYSDEDTDLLF